MSHFCTKRQKEWSKMVMLEGGGHGEAMKTSSFSLRPHLFRAMLILFFNEGVEQTRFHLLLQDQDLPLAHFSFC